MNATGLIIAGCIALIGAIAISRGAMARDQAATVPIDVRPPAHDRPQADTLPQRDPLPEDDVRPVGEQGMQAIETAPGFGSVVHRLRIEEPDLKIVTLRGDNDSDLNLAVYDESGQVLASDTSRGDDVLLSVAIEEPQIIAIVIQNLGPSRNTYVLSVY